VTETAAETLPELLERAARSSRGVVFLDAREREQRVSYSDLAHRARRAAAALRVAGVRRGDRVGLVLPTGPGFYDAFFGALRAGAVPVPLYPPVRLGRLDEYHASTAAMLRACQARLVLCDQRTRRILGRALLDARPELGCLDVEDLVAGRAEAPSRPGATALPAEDLAAEGDELAFIQFSSGSTVAPKPVCLGHRAVLANVHAIHTALVTAWPDGEDGLVHVGVSWLPLYHDMGLVGGVLVAMSHPADLVLLPPELFVARPASWLRAISRYRGTISPAPNFAYGLCADRVREGELDGVDLSSWRVALNGAEPVTPHVLERFVERFTGRGLRPEALTPVYGLSEATLAVCFGDLRRSFRWQGFDRDALNREGRAVVSEGGQPVVSVGRPLPGFEIRIRDHDGVELEAGRIGRVWVRGPSVMQGYHDRPEATAQVLRDGWLDTGDLGFLDKDELYLHGRARDLLIAHGRNHAPQEVEQCLDDVEGVRTGCSAAVGLLPEGADGEQLIVLVERRTDATREQVDTLSERARRRILERTGLVPAEVVVLAPGTLPRTSSGKIRRAEAGRRHLAGELAPPARVGPVALARALLRSRWALLRLRRGG